MNLTQHAVMFAMDLLSHCKQDVSLLLSLLARTRSTFYTLFISKKIVSLLLPVLPANCDHMYARLDLQIYDSFEHYMSMFSGLLKSGIVVRSIFVSLSRLHFV